MDIHGYPPKNGLDIDMDMDMDAIFHLHSKPVKLTSPSASVASRRITVSQRLLRNVCLFVLDTTQHN